jgi:hypothetical protein
MGGCPATGYRGGYLRVTNYVYDVPSASRTAAGVRYWAPAKDDTPEFRKALDAKTGALRGCLKALNPKWVVRADWFYVLVPPDWYVSTCSKQQLVPSKMPCKLCIEQKKLPLPEKCCGLVKPTAGCPCVCNARATIQDDGKVKLVVTAPNLLLYKAELARLVTFVNNPWAHEGIRKCLQ